LKKERRDLKREQARIYDGLGKGMRGEFESSVKIEAVKQGGAVVILYSTVHALGFWFSLGGLRFRYH
jgi:hypothetical protein